VKLAYDPVERHQKIEKLVIRSKVGGDLKKYYRFRHDRWYGESSPRTAPDAG
jgi:uncharacterized Fe-S cluster-containing radical SAM superfamily protein